MLFAEWSGSKVEIYDHNRTHIRTIRSRHPVIGVQISGDSETDAYVAIAMANGRTDVFLSSGQIYRHV